ncbi:MAG: efflux transporter outer membrane subunit [Archangium sp.]|nr:efflux transporter outer membrane subunit [Archangium sp.]
MPSRELLKWAPVVLLCVTQGCAALSTNLTIPEKKLPETFEVKSAAPSVAQVSWRTWFEDPRLTELIGEALGGNPDLAMALQRVEVARAGVKQATGALFPRLDLSVGAGVRKFGLYTMDGAGNATTDITPGQLVPTHLGDFALGLQTSWEVDLWGKLRNQRQAVVSTYLASVEGTHLVTTSLVAEVATAWFELQALDRVHEVLVETATRQAEALEVVRLQKSAGRASELAVQQFEAQLADTRALEVGVAQQRVETENRLNFLLGRAPQPIDRKTTLAFEALPAISAGLPSELLRYRPDVREAELQVQASQFDLKSAQAAFFPNINLSAGVGLQAFNPAYLFRLPESLFYSLLGGLVAPLVNRSAIEANFDGAKASQLQAMYNYQKVVLNAFVEVATGLSNIQNTEKILALRKEQKEAVEKSVETADILYRAGKASYLEVLAAQQTALRADLELIETWRRQRVASVAIYRALGGGWQ